MWSPQDERWRSGRTQKDVCVCISTCVEVSSYFPQRMWRMSSLHLCWFWLIKGCVCTCNWYCDSVCERKCGLNVLTWLACCAVPRERRQGDTGFRMRGSNGAVKMGIEKGNGNSSLLVCNLCNVVCERSAYTFIIHSIKIFASHLCPRGCIMRQEASFLYVCVCNCVCGVVCIYDSMSHPSPGPKPWNWIELT